MKFTGNISGPEIAATSVRDRRSGFTLVEIMIVVGIIGLLAAIAIPSFMKARRGARIRAVANDLRVFSDAFEMYSMAAGRFPHDGVDLGELPPGLEEYIDPEKFTAPTPFGGRYYYKATEFGAFDFAPAVGVYNVTDLSAMQELDALIDDGNLASGFFRRWLASSGYYVVMEE